MNSQGEASEPSIKLPLEYERGKPNENDVSSKIACKFQREKFLRVQKVTIHRSIPTVFDGLIHRSLKADHSFKSATQLPRVTRTHSDI